ncbi:ABC transporter substrate-binding protein [Sphingomonas sp. 28-63-12]|uniref:ABC transporter substrate-binding protein n=1 Tax=Sphingomonas sp. 28-63-12 TaxID=1970434 RepID=UPI000BDAB052|nr:MAG: hopanoid biosynthesis protein HpnM [Sphingomonas sp. 28-63-12]
MIVLPRFTLAAAIAMTALPTAALAQDAARAPVQTLSDGLITIMKAGKKAGFAARAGQIAPIVDKSFDLPLLTRLAVGPAWTDAAAADRTALVAAMRKLTINQYASNFDGWSGQAFVIDPKVDTRGTDRLVKTVLTQPKESGVSISYRLRQSGGDWRIIDVFYQNSISQLATRRADFEAILAKGGVKALVGHVNALADKASR